MALEAVRNHLDYLASSLTPTLAWDEDGNLFLEPDNFYPNQYGQEPGESGPEGWSSEGMPPRVTGYHVNVSRPGTLPASPPRRNTTTRQTTAPIDEAWTMEGPLVGGIRPSRAAEGRKELPPVVEVVATDVRGFREGTWGYAVGFADRRKRPTTASGARFFTLTQNQVFDIPVPDAFPPGAHYLDIYLTKRNGGANTLALHRRVPVNRLRGASSYTVRGPRRVGPPPPATNRSGLGVPNTPKVGGNVRVVPAEHDLKAGFYRLYLQLKNERGASLLSRASSRVKVAGDLVPQEDPPEAAVARETAYALADAVYAPGGSADDGLWYECTTAGTTAATAPAYPTTEGQTVTDGTAVFVCRAMPRTVWVEGPVKKGAGIHCRPPVVSRRNREITYTYWIYYEPPSGGSGTYYRAYLKRNRFGGTAYFPGTVPAPVIHGFPDEEAAKGMRVGLAQEEPPTEDGSIVAAPDPSGVPDEPAAKGAESPAPGTYLVTASGELEGGGETRESEPVQVTIATGQTMRVTPQKSVNLLRNAEFSHLDATGAPAGWTPNMGTVGTYDVTDGVLGIDMTTAASTSLPSVVSTAIPVSSDTVLTLAGSLGITRRSSGTARVVMRQLDASGATLVDTVLYDLAALGHVAFKQTFGPGHTAWDPNVASVQVIPRVGLGSDTQANLRMEASRLKALPFAADVRRVEKAEPGSGETDDFDASPSTPLEGSSFYAAGPAPTPQGTQEAESEPPLEVVDFESGAWPAGWTEGAASATEEISATGALHGSLGWRIQDTSTTAKQYRYRYKTYPVSGDSFALRALVKIATNSGAGQQDFFVVVQCGGLRFEPSTNRLWLYRYDAGSGTYSATHIATAAGGDLLDVEIQSAGVGTNGGTLTVGLGRNGASRSVVYSQGGHDWRGVTPGQARVGTAFATDPKVRYDLRYDQVVATERGDVLNRETPPPPSGYTPPPYDAPTLSGAPRLYDPDDERIAQPYLFVMPGDGPVEVEMLEEPLAVKPGQDYTYAVFSRWANLTEEASEVRVILEGEDAEPYVAASWQMEGTRGWHPASEEDDHAVFSVPAITEGEPLYHRARIVLYLQSGVYVFQEPLLTRGSYAAFADRDMRRGYGRATEGEGTFTLPAVPEGYELGPRFGVFWSGLGVRYAEDPPEGTYAEASYASSDDPTAFSGETSDPATLTPREYLRTRVYISGDGRNTPVVPAGGIYLRTWHPVGALMREDGSHFPGVAWAGNLLYESTYPDTETERVGGHYMRVRTTEDVGRLPDGVIAVTTEEAAQEIEALSAEPEAAFVISAPTAGGTVGGRSWLVRLGAQVRFEPADVPPRISGERRVFYATAEIAEPEILESSPLPPPLTPGVG